MNNQSNVDLSGFSIKLSFLTAMLIQSSDITEENTKQNQNMLI